jgi:hypothetical protein
MNGSHRELADHLFTITTLPEGGVPSKAHSISKGGRAKILLILKNLPSFLFLIYKSRFLDS